MLERGRANVRESSSSSSSSSVWTFFPLLFFLMFSERKVPQMEKEKKTKRRKKKREEGSFHRRLSSSSPPTHSNSIGEGDIHHDRVGKTNSAMREHRTRGAFFFRALVSLSLSLSFSLSLRVCVRVCSVLRWRRSVLSFFSRKPTTLKNQKNQSRNTNALVTKINQRRRLSLRLFVHDDIDAFPSR